MEIVKANQTNYEEAELDFNYDIVPKIIDSIVSGKIWEIEWFSSAENKNDDNDIYLDLLEILYSDERRRRTHELEGIFSDLGNNKYPTTVLSRIETKDGRVGDQIILQPVFNKVKGLSPKSGDELDD